MKAWVVRIFGLVVLAGGVRAQIYSPLVLREGQPDSTNLKKLAAGIYRMSGAVTPHEKAEAIWRFFLTDGRFVKPGFWYHIAGWTYEEPSGEVLDPIKLLNSYGFGLCYHIAPLLEAVYEAGGFDDARVWFLTGHTVTEVFYEGAYHYFDSDMMGYNVAGSGPFRGKPVASVRQLESDSDIILGKLASAKQQKEGAVDVPWYPADVRASAMGDLARLFTTTRDNYLFPYKRYSPGHSMDFVLRPGEKLIRYFHPEEPGLFYLPYTFDGEKWKEFPQELSGYKIRTTDGPRSQKDSRLWATGRIEYEPPVLGAGRVLTFDMPSPYVIIDAHFSMRADLPSPETELLVETSIDNGSTWEPAGDLKGPYQGNWETGPRVLVKSEHGRWTAVSGSYGYQVRLTSHGVAPQIAALKVTSRIQLNPRTLPALDAGDNSMVYSAEPPMRRVTIPVRLESAGGHGFELARENGQAFLKPAAGQTGELLCQVSANGSDLTGAEIGARFLDLRGNLAPEKTTAETRHTAVVSARGEAAIEWSLLRQGPFQKLWSYPQKLAWRDGDPIDRVLLWPEAFEHIGPLPPGTKTIYVRLRSAGPALDNIRLIALAKAKEPAGQLRITQTWTENGVARQHMEEIPAGVHGRRYRIATGSEPQNDSIIFELIP